MKQANNFFELEEKHNGDVFWCRRPIKKLGVKRVDFVGDKFDITPDI